MKPEFWILYDFLFGSSILGNVYVLASIGCRGSNLASCYHVLFPTLTFSILGEALFSQANVFNRVADSCIAAMVLTNYFQVMNLTTVLMLFLYHRFTLFRDRFGVKFFILKYGHLILAIVPLIVLLPFVDTYYTNQSAYDDDRSTDDTVTTEVASAIASWTQTTLLLSSSSGNSTTTTTTTHHHEHSYFCVALPYYSTANFNWTLSIVFVWAMAILLVMMVGIGNMSRVLFYDYSDRTNVYFSDDGSSWRSSQFAARPTEDDVNFDGLEAANPADPETGHTSSRRKKSKSNQPNPMINKINMWLINQFFSSVGIYCLICMFVVWIPRVVYFFYYSFEYKDGHDKSDNSQMQIDRAGYYAIGQVFPLYIGSILLTMFFIREQYLLQHGPATPHPALERLSDFDPTRLSQMPQDSEYSLRSTRTSLQLVPTATNSIVTTANPIRGSQITSLHHGEEGYGYGGKQSIASTIKEENSVEAAEENKDTEN